MEVFVLRYLTMKRSSGRGLSVTRRSPQPLRKGVAAAMNKAELVAHAEASGLDTSGTKADLVGRLSVPESNDADVEPADD